MVSASREFQIFVKPTGAICNLACRYCYYLRTRDLYPNGESFRMPDDLLEQYIVQHIEACPRPTILFSWHGGEPTLLGLDYFRRVVALQYKHRPPDREIINGIQTNGVLVDDAWCRFLKAERFHVGLSLDGPAELHAPCRVTKGQRPTHKLVMQSFRLLQRHRIPCDVLCVVHDQNVRHPGAVYRFFKGIGVRYLQFLPLVQRREGGGVSPETVPAEAYGTFLCTIFREWIRQDLGRIDIQLFDEATRPFLGVEHALCIFRKTCGDFPVIEHNGDLFACDHFVDRKHYVGNIRERPLVEMLESPPLREFGEKKWDALPRDCRECDVLAMCNGACPKDRFLRTPEGEEGLNYLCAGLKGFFTYSRPYLQRLASWLRAGAPVERFMQLLQFEDARASVQTGRNDPCPCGSGRKFKKCCLGKSSL
ncbi:MAG: anaerobic sulfatase maturase [Acidobacteria bacterium RIFCSPLOWO2_02_FULL_64_15]|nr:MAG: anaerobic sulfatase maturase [Acidobacteria bacterium RIFCSPLOWO2_02_FULL_64_15]